MSVRIDGPTQIKTLQVKPLEHDERDSSKITESIRSMMASIEQEIQEGKEVISVLGDDPMAKQIIQTHGLMEQCILRLVDQTVTQLSKGEPLRSDTAISAFDAFAKSCGFTPDEIYPKEGEVADQLRWIYEYLYSSAASLGFARTCLEFV